MQKALMQMNVQLHHVVADITGVTGMTILRAIVGGTHDPDVLARYRDARCTESGDTIRAALVGNYRPEHVFALRQALELYDFLQTKIAECDAEIESTLRDLNADRPLPAAPLPSATRPDGTSRGSTCGRPSTRSWAATSARSMASVRTRSCAPSPGAATTCGSGRRRSTSPRG
jgi:hypothetical protein